MLREQGFNEDEYKDAEEEYYLRKKNYEELLQRPKASHIVKDRAAKEVDALEAIFNIHQTILNLENKVKN